MKTDITKATAEAAEGTLFLGDDGSILWKLGCGPAFAASSRNSWKRNSMLRLGGTGMNGLGLPRPAEAAGRVWGLATGTAIASVSDGKLRAGDGPCPSSPPGSIGREDGRGEECDHSGLPAADETGRRADRWRLSCRDQHAPGAPGRSRLCSEAPWGRTRSAEFGTR